MSYKFDINNVIGYPPLSNDDLNARMKNSFPILEIYPLVPTKDINFFYNFDINQGRQEYNRIISNYGLTGISGSNKPLRIAFMGESIPSESFANDYTQSIFQGITNSASNMMSSIGQIFGGRSASEIFNLGGRSASEIFNLEGMAKLFPLNDYLIEKPEGMIQNVIQAMNQGFAGGRLDFPLIWGGSSFSPSYSVHVKLYNINPKSIEMTRESITKPLLAILALGLPRIQNSANMIYTWPFLQKIISKGMFFLNPCGISNITIQKGGDLNSIAFNGRPEILDIRIDFVSLYSTMIMTEDGNSISNRPNLKDYLDNILNAKDTFYYESLKTDQGYEKVERTISENSTGSTSNNTASVSSNNTTEIVSRVNSESRAIYENIKS